MSSPTGAGRSLAVVRGACPHDCPDTCAWEVTVEDGRAVGLRGVEDHPLTQGRLCARCRSCRREYDALYWRRTRDNRVRLRRAHRRDLVEWYRAMKEGNPCADCGEAFHHVAMH